MKKARGDERRNKKVTNREESVKREEINRSENEVKQEEKRV